MITNTTALLTEYANTMSFVNHHRAVVLMLQLDNLWKLGQITLHGEHTIDDNQFNGLMGQLLKHALEVVHVVVLIMQLLCKSKTSAIHNTCMVAVVADYVIILVQQGWNNTLVDAETGRKAQAVGLTNILSDFFLQLNMNVERTVEETASGATRAISV